MQIVKLADFVKLPRGTVFQHAEPKLGDTLYVLVGGVGDWDYQYDALNGDRDLLEYGKLEGVEVEPDFRGTTRAGTCQVHAEDKFIVWSAVDVDALIERLQESKEEIARESV